MVSINGLPPGLPGAGNVSRTPRQVPANDKATSDSQPTQRNPVASAVANSIRTMNSEDFQKAELQYDLPEGKARKALEQYFNVMNQPRREELAQMMGVDIFI